MGPSETPPDIRELLASAMRSGHIGSAVWISAILEENLAALIGMYMPKLSNRLKERLFTGYGPLGSFSAKIDIAFALDIIPDALRHDLHVMREVRNEFAHSIERLHFESTSIKDLFAKFSSMGAAEAPHIAFFDKANDLLLQIYDLMHPLLMVKALTASIAAKPPSSPEKSGAPSPRHRRRSRDDTGTGG